MSAELTAVEAENERGMTLSKKSVTVPEGGAVTYTVKLNAAPSGDVTVTAAVTGDDDIVVQLGSSLKFTTTSWSTPKTVRLAATADGDGLDGTATITHTATGGSYNNLTATLTAAEADDDRKLIGVANSLFLSEGSSDSFKMGLNTVPSGTVTITVNKKTGGDPSLAVDTDPDAAGNQNTFTLTKAYNANDPTAHHTIKVSAGDDADAYNAAESDSFTFTASGGGYDDASKSFDVNVTDDDAIGLAPFRGLTGRKASWAIGAGDVAWVREGGTVTVPVRLASRPNGDVTVTATRPNNPNNFPFLAPEHADLTVDLDAGTPGVQDTMTFTFLNWNVPQNITLAAKEEAPQNANDPADDTTDSRGSILLAVASTADSKYTASQQINLQEADNDVTGRALTLSASSLSVIEGLTTTYTVALASKPDNDVVVTVARTSGDTDLSVSGTSSFTFTTTNWNTGQTVTLAAAQDDDDFTNGSAVFTHTATDGGFTGVTAELTATELDNDVVAGRALTLSASGLTVPEGGTAAYNVALAVAPVGTVTVAVTKKEDGDPDLTASPDMLTFTTQNWSTAQRVTLRAAEDGDRQAGGAVFVHTATGGGYGYGGGDATVAELAATERENDILVVGRVLSLVTVGVTVPPSGVTVPEGGTSTYTVALSEAPYGPVTVAVAKKEGGDPDLTVDTDPNTEGVQGTLTFTTTDWSMPQTVTLRAAEDGDREEGKAVFVHTATGGGYGEGTGATVAELTATEEENDLLVVGRALVLSASGVTVPEGGTSTYTVALSEAPYGPVTVAVAKKEGGDPDLTVDTDPNTEGVQGTLTFTTTDWNEPQAVTLRAAEDGDREEGKAVFVHTATGGGYGAGVDTTVAELTATEEENDLLVVGRALVLSASGVTVPEGGTSTYAVALSVAPYGPVTVAVMKKEGGDPDLTVDTDPNTEGVQGTLTFTTTDWNEPQAVTLRAAEDGDREEGKAVFVHTATGGGYGAGVDTTVAELTATEEENDLLVVGRALVLSASGVMVPEGKTASYTVALAVAPYDPVTVTVARAAGDDTDLTAAPATLTFTATDWNTPQMVTLSAAEDDDGERGEAVFIHTATGGGYGEGAEATVAELTATEEDNFVPKARERLAQANEAILPEILRAVVQHKIDNVVSRVVSQAVSGMIGTDDALAAAAHLLARHGEAIQDGVFSWREALAGVDFALPLSDGKDGADGKRGSGIALWAMGDYLHLSDDRPVEWSGGLFGAHVGSDVRIGRNLRAGLGLSWEEGSFDYIHRLDDGDEVAGTEEVRMTSVYPYAGWRFPGGSNLWATVGYGQGEVEFEDNVLDRQRGDLRQLMAAAGGTARLAEAEGALFGGEGTLDVKTQVSLGRLAVADNGAMIPKTTVSAYGARVALEGSEAIGLAGGRTLTPSLEAGLRWDGGDGETGAGLELGGGLDYTDRALGLSAGARGRALVAHESGLREWGASGWLRLVADSLGRGLSLEASPSWGKSASGVDDLWQRGVAGAADEARGEPPQMRFDVEVGYGLAAPPGRRGLLTPYAGFGVTEGGSRSYRAGTRFELGAATMIDLEGSREDDAAGASEHAVALRMTVYW